MTTGKEVGEMGCEILQRFLRAVAEHRANPQRFVTVVKEALNALQDNRITVNEAGSLVVRTMAQMATA